MKWITFNQAVKLAGIAISTGRLHLRHLKKTDPELYHKLVRKAGRILFLKNPEIVAHFKVDLRKIKPTPQMANTSRQTKKYILPTHFIPEDIKKRAERLMKEPYIIEIEPEIQEYLNKIQSETDRYRVLTTIAICEEFTHGIYSLEKCCKYQGIDCSTFYRWRKKLGALNTLFKKSQKKRKKSITETEVDDYHTTLRLLAMGFYYEVVTTIYDIYQDITGKVFKIPKTMRITKKYHPPNLKAAIFGLINRAPKKWKLYPSFEQKLQSKKKADDDFAGWTPKQIRDWLKKHDPDFGN